MSPPTMIRPFDLANDGCLQSLSYLRSRRTTLPSPALNNYNRMHRISVRFCLETVSDICMYTCAATRIRDSVCRLRRLVWPVARERNSFSLYFVRLFIHSFIHSFSR